MALAFSTASQPRLSAGGPGADQIWYQPLIAMPQYAIAQSGSAWVTAVNALIDSRYQNECRSATARSNGFCTSGRHETGNVTCPIRSSEVCADRTGKSTHAIARIAAIVLVISASDARLVLSEQAVDHSLR